MCNVLISMPLFIDCNHIQVVFISKLQAFLLKHRKNYIDSARYVYSLSSTHQMYIHIIYLEYCNVLYGTTVSHSLLVHIGLHTHTHTHLSIYGNKGHKSLAKNPKYLSALNL